MAWAPVHKVVLGCIAFITFWVLAVFPSVPFLPIGRTAGSLLGAALMVVFQVESPKEAFASVDLPILGLLFGTMAVSVYLERADLFQYLGNFLSWRSMGGKDLLCRVCFLSAVSSALFTNDTTCVVLTAFVLRVCKEKNLRPQPFLMALATSANIGSAATPIGNPQNLIIAVTSGISFGKFLFGILPAVVTGMVVNTLGLLLLYWGKLNLTNDVEAPVVEESQANKDQIPSTIEEGKLAPLEAEKTVGARTPRSMGTSKSASVAGSPQPVFHGLEAGTEIGKDGQIRLLPRKTYNVWQDQTVSLEDGTPDIGRMGARAGEMSPLAVGILRSRASPAPGFEMRHAPMEMTEILRLESPSAFGNRQRQRSRSLSYDHHLRSMSYDQQMGASPAPSAPFSASVSVHPTPGHEVEKSGSDTPDEKYRRRLFKVCVYTVTLGMLAALLAGLDLSWSAITAAVILMIIDFGDAGPSLDQVSYSLLVFFSGMFIAVDGFNRTGAPSALWNAVEPYSRVNELKGTLLLSVVVILLSNVASNVPTVLLLGARVALSAQNTPGASVTKAWLILAWVSTVAGNLTLVGSAANLIVSEQARRAQTLGYNLSFWNHLRFGVPSTFIVVIVGLFTITG